MTPAEAIPTPGIRVPLTRPRPADDERAADIGAEKAARLRLENTSEDERDLLLALTVGFDLSVPLPPHLCHGDPDVGPLVVALQQARLIDADGAPDPMIRRLVFEVTPLYRATALRRELLDVRASAGIAADEVTREMARAGVRDPRLAAALEHAGDLALALDPVLAAELYAEAESAGADAVAIAARRAQATLAAGDLTTAGILVDDLLARPDPPDLPRAVDVAAAIWAHRGSYERSAELHLWLGAGRSATPTSTLSLAGAGFRQDAEAVLDRPGSAAPPSSHSTAIRLLCEGVVRSLGPDGTAALPALIRASDAMSASGLAVPLPETAASIAALVALHCGEIAVARNVLDEALARGQGGPGARARLLLLSGWTDMHRDDLGAATEKLDAVRASGDLLPPRDLLVAAALELGIARRSDDAPGLLRAWRQAWELLMHVSPDLYALLPLGELVIAGARVRESDRIRDHITEAWSLLERLGAPALWSSLLHWSEIQSAILQEQPDELAPHAAALLRAAAHEPMAAVLAAAAGAWVGVLSGASDDVVVEDASRALAGRGLAWDGARLAGHAAARVGDRRRMARLLACARELRATAERSPVAPAPGLTGGPPARSRTSSVLTPREQEIARLVLDGLTHREIGEAIFVSTRTAEHHIAALRRRLGATTRAELLAGLRTALAGMDPHGP